MPKLVLVLILLAFHVKAASVEDRTNVQSEQVAPASETSELGFPIDIQWHLKGERYQFEFTGESQRKFLFMRIYDVAHYVENKAAATLISDVLEGRAARQLSIRYHHDISASRVRSALWDGFERNASEKEWTILEPMLDSVLDGINRDVRDGDELTMRWLSDDRVLFYYNNKLVSGYQDKLFARILWSIWLGGKSVVDEEELTEYLRRPYLPVE